MYMTIIDLWTLEGSKTLEGIFKLHLKVAKANQYFQKNQNHKNLMNLFLFSLLKYKAFFNMSLLV